MKCKKCGQEIPNDSIYCEFCGTKQVNIKVQESTPVLNILVSLLIPPLGFILFLVHKKDKPADAKKYLWCSIGGFLAAILLIIFAIVIISISYEYSYNNYNNYYNSPEYYDDAYETAEAYPEETVPVEYEYSTEVVAEDVAEEYYEDDTYYY